MATIAAKLAATEREADAARVRAKLKAARMNKAKTSTVATAKVPLKEGDDVVSRSEEGKVGGQGGVSGENEGEVEVEVEAEVSKKRKPKVQGGRANRRRSTLSPWEMESLILGGLGGGSPLKEVS